MDDRFDLPQYIEPGVNADVVAWREATYRVLVVGLPSRGKTAFLNASGARLAVPALRADIETLGIDSTRDLRLQYLVGESQSLTFDGAVYRAISRSAGAQREASVAIMSTAGQAHFPPSATFLTQRAELPDLVRSADAILIMVSAIEPPRDDKNWQNLEEADGVVDAATLIPCLNVWQTPTQARALVVTCLDMLAPTRGIGHLLGELAAPNLESGRHRDLARRLSSAIRELEVAQTMDGALRRFAGMQRLEILGMGLVGPDRRPLGKPLGSLRREESTAVVNVGLADVWAFILESSEKTDVVTELWEE